MARLLFRSAKRKAVARPPPVFIPKTSLLEQARLKEQAQTTDKKVKASAPPPPPKRTPVKFKQGELPTPRPNRATQNLERVRKAIENDEPHFRVGERQVYLPMAKVVLLRPNAKHTPYQAKFAVPKYFNKLDLRDYLYHVYGLRALNITTQLSFTRWTRDTIRSPRYRTTQIKKMTIDMIDPFVWPKQPSASEMAKMLNLELRLELEKYIDDSRRLGSDKNKEPTSFGGILGPFPAPPQPFVPKYVKKNALRIKEKDARLAARAEDEALVKKYLNL